MRFLTEKRFSFVSSALAEDSFGVVHFTGTEGLSFLYEFDITLITDDPALDLDAVLQQPATFTIHRPDDRKVDFHGILAHFEQLHEFNDCIFYRALLRPRLWWLTLTQHNQVCLDLPIVPPPQGAAQGSVLGQVLRDGGLSDLDYAFRTQKSYAPLEYVCQYGESHYDFMARWLEREGLYYFFEQSASGEQLVITDSALSHVDLPQQGQLLYTPASGLDAHHHEEAIKVLTCRQRMLPKKVLFRDHNYERPTLEVSGEAQVDPKGRGETYVYGEYFSTPEEGNRLAAIYAEALLCRKIELYGESTVPFLAPGYTFSLDRHYRRDFNTKYLITEVRHEGNQTGYLVSGLQGALSDVEQAVSYRNSFTAIPATVQFRPERSTRKPRIAGTLHASIDAEGSGQYAELDDQGRYKVRLPFDLNDEHQAGKASCFLRMAQPYAGPKRGMHFPLPKGTEILLTFIGGDPDRPVIAAAVPNPEAPSPSTARNQTEAVICTGGSNKVRLEDRQGRESIVLESPTADSWVRLGAPHDGSIHDNGVNGIRLHTTEELWLEAEERFGEYHSGRNGAAPKKASGETVPKTGDLLANFDSVYKPSGMLSRHGGAAQQWSAVVDAAHVSVSSLDTVNTQEGNIYDFGGYWNYNLGNCYRENHMDQKATLNAKLDYDLLDKGGPNFTKLEFPTLKDGASSALDGTWPPAQGMWVEKKVGNSYDYARGDSVEVRAGSSLDIRHGGRHIEVSYRGDGSLASWSWKEKGVTEERVWTEDGICIEYKTSDFNASTSSKTVYDCNIGTLASYSTEANTGGGLASFGLTMVAKATSDIKLAAVSAFSLEVAGKVEIALSAAAEIKIGVAAALQLEMWTNPSGKLQLKNSKFEYHGLGSQLDKEEAVKAGIKDLYLEQTLGWITKNDFEARKQSLTMRVQNLGLDSGIYMMGL
ncbi:type VI secretion system Vgr family protein [Desulfobulbus elongatus]|uniref:type VI secretion system Vgr family protein n=1 Tax=Desulfobulbus elongatus TaxID=53332 RepID=UPI0006869D78|nr:type VI secretion system tip protein TssI/VgrG [Desulfobulbus elongatus]